jgi:hypothetical protein
MIKVHAFAAVALGLLVAACDTGDRRSTTGSGSTMGNSSATGAGNAPMGGNSMGGNTTVAAAVRRCGAGEQPDERPDPGRALQCRHGLNNNQNPSSGR